MSKELTAALSKADKKDNGIYFTPPSCVHHNIKLLLPHLPKKAATNAKFRILEPSFGSGEYITALRASFPVSDITGVEKNKTIFDAVVQKYFPTTMPTPGITLLNADFLAYESGAPYNLIIGNPPYFVMKKEEVDAAYQQYYDGRPNIFILFIIKCLRMRCIMRQKMLLFRDVSYYVLLALFYINFLFYIIFVKIILFILLHYNIWKIDLNKDGYNK